MGEAESEGLSLPDLPAPKGLRFLSVLSEGRRSRWLLAEQVSLGRTVALKCLHPFLGVSAALRDAFFDAARQAAAMVHPAALSVINIYRDSHCIAMQLAKGRPLREMRHTLEPLRAFIMGEAVMDALSSLHATGRCHGNLTPGNVFLHENEVEIGDFFQPPQFIADTFCFYGEKEFIAPEIVGGNGGRDWTADAFSLGQLLHFSINPEKLTDDIVKLTDLLRSGDLCRRDITPQTILNAFRRLRREEEARLGLEEGRRVKRMYRRVPAEFDVSLRRRSATPDETVSILMKIRDIGESGVFVETDDELIGIGSILELDFALKGVEGNVHAFGVVRWRSSPPMPKGVGVQFVEVEQAGLSRLRRFLQDR